MAPRFLPRSSRARALWGAAALVIAVYAVEIGARAVLRPRLAVAAALSLRHAGERAYPMVSAKAVLELDDGGRARSAIRLDGREILPLGGVAGVTTLTDDGAGAVSRFTSDEGGFENPPGLWGRAPIDVLLLGDELALGAGVAPDVNLAAPVRALFPATVNLGAVGQGPLAELAELREYGPVLRPKAAVILFSEGDDLRDLEREKGSLLARYLERDFGQDLAAQHDGLQGALVQYEDGRLAEADALASKAQAVLGLGRLRELSGIGLAASAAAGAPFDHAYYRQVLREAKRALAAWEGEQLWLVYLPSWSRFAGPAAPPALDRDRAAVISIARGEGLSILDAASVLEVAGDPRDGFDARHRYNERGYRLLGEAIRDRLVVAGQVKQDIGSLPVVRFPYVPRKRR